MNTRAEFRRENCGNSVTVVTNGVSFPALNPLYEELLSTQCSSRRQILPPFDPALEFELGDNTWTIPRNPFAGFCRGWANP